MIEGVDFSGTKPSLPALRAAGVRFVVRYVSAGIHSKEITPDEAAFWKAAGMAIVIVYESTAGRALEGGAAGAADARAARADVIACGGPADGGVVYFAVDVDTTTDQQRATVAAYLTGAASVLGWDQVGVYGEFEVVDYLTKHTPCRWFWQTYAWSRGKLHPAAQLYQYQNGVSLGGVEVDRDRALTDNYGQWFAQATEEDVPLTDAEIDKIAQKTWEKVAVGLSDPTHQYLQDELQPLKNALDQIRTGVAAQADDEAKVLGALAALKLNLSDAQIEQISDHIGIDYDKIREAVQFQVSWPTAKAGG